MDKPKIAHVDEYGVKEYNPLFLLLMLFGVLYAIIGVLAYPLLIVEMDAAGSNTASYADSFWLLQMAASTIGFGDHYPVTTTGRMLVVLMFYIGMGVAGGIAGIVMNFFMKFSDTAVKNRELRRQNAEIIESNDTILAEVKALRLYLGEQTNGN